MRIISFKGAEICPFVFLKGGQVIIKNFDFSCLKKLSKIGEEIGN
jgi:hypothetical protein